LSAVADWYRTLRAADKTLALSISADPIGTHHVFSKLRKAGPLPFPMVSDSGHVAGNAYSAYDPQAGRNDRVTCIVDPQGIIRHHGTYDQAIGRSRTEIDRIVRALWYHAQTGRVTPADWQPGDPGSVKSLSNLPV
jgi:peroxiredoxin (alkyl hydroperoxide reductase subunit C)